jgi:hypothetical protein
VGVSALLGRIAVGCALALAAAASAAQPLAIATEVHGSVARETAGRTVALELLDELVEAASVRLEDGARLTALYLRSGAQYEITGPGAVRFDAQGPAASGGASVTARPAPGDKQLRLRSSGLAQGGIVVRSGGLRLATPTLTVLEQSPEFVWFDLRQGGRYRYRLADAEGAAVHEADTDSRVLRLPPGIVLRRGVQYRWRVEPTDGERAGAEALFRVADEDLVRRVATLRPGPNAGFAERVAFALWLEDAGLQGEAVKLWRELAAARPDSAALRSRAARGG